VRRGAMAALVLASLFVAGCGSGGSADRTTLRVLAAASLTEPFTALEKTYEKAHPGVDVALSFDSSAILVEQLSQGLDADVLATADQKSMDQAVSAGVVTGKPRAFATNTLVIVTPHGNPAKVTGIDDLERVTFAVCVPAAPCGDATRRLFALDHVTAKPTTEEESVKGVLTKVVTGEVDAGLVYVSDARSAGDQVHPVRAANSSEVVNVDPIAAVKGSREEAAQAWIELVTGVQGRKVLKSHGFGPPA
jgi:molybdate transport system substrate-binding protein